MEHTPTEQGHQNKCHLELCISKSNSQTFWPFKVGHSITKIALSAFQHLYTFTSSTAQGGGGSFKNRKPIGKVGCCESGMAERIHWWIERWLMSPLFLSLSFSDYLPTYLPIYLSTYLSIYRSLSLSFSSVYLSSCLPVYLSIYLSVCLSLSLSLSFVYLSSCLAVYLSIYLFYLSICGAVSLSVM